MEGTTKTFLLLFSVHLNETMSKHQMKLFAFDLRQNHPTRSFNAKSKLKKKRGKWPDLLCWNLLVGKQFCRKNLVFIESLFVEKNLVVKRFFLTFLLTTCGKDQIFVEVFVEEISFRFYHIYLSLLGRSFHFYFNIFEQLLHIVCPIKGLFYMGHVGSFNENVFPGVFRLA